MFSQICQGTNIGSKLEENSAQLTVGGCSRMWVWSKMLFENFILHPVSEAAKVIYPQTYWFESTALSQWNIFKTSLKLLQASINTPLFMFACMCVHSYMLCSLVPIVHCISAYFF